MLTPLTKNSNRKLSHNQSYTLPLNKSLSISRNPYIFNKKSKKEQNAAVLSTSQTIKRYSTAKKNSSNSMAKIPFLKGTFSPSRKINRKNSEISKLNLQNSSNYKNGTVVSPASKSTYTEIFFSKKLKKIVNKPKKNFQNFRNLSNNRIGRSMNTMKSSRMFVYEDSSKLKNLGFGKIS